MLAFGVYLLACLALRVATFRTAPEEAEALKRVRVAMVVAAAHWPRHHLAERADRLTDSPGTSAASQRPVDKRKGNDQDARNWCADRHPPPAPAPCPRPAAARRTSRWPGRSWQRGASRSDHLWASTLAAIMATPSADDYADGSVHALTMGPGELRGILQAAAYRRQLVVVDYSASWWAPSSSYSLRRLFLRIAAPLPTNGIASSCPLLLDGSSSTPTQALARTQNPCRRCGPCRMIYPVLQQMAREYRGRVAFVKVRGRFECA